MAAAAGHARRAGRSRDRAAAARSATSTTAIRSSSEFKDPRNGNFANIRFFRYRGLDAGADRPRAGAVRRWRARRWWSARSGAGRVIAFTSTLDSDWNDFPQHATVPAARPRDRELPGAVRRARGVVHRRPHARHLGADRRDRARRAGGRSQAAARSASGVVVSPSGEQVTLGEGGCAVGRARRAGVLLRPAPGHGRPPAVSGRGQPRPGRVRPVGAPAGRVRGAIGTGRRRPPTGQSLEHPELDAGRYREEAVALVVPVRGRAWRRCSSRPCWRTGSNRC